MIYWWITYKNYEILVNTNDLDTMIDILQINGKPESILLDLDKEEDFIKRLEERGFKKEAKEYKKLIA